MDDLYGENPIKIDDLGVPLFQEASISVWQYAIGPPTDFASDILDSCSFLGLHIRLLDSGPLKKHGRKGGRACKIPWLMIIFSVTLLILGVCWQGFNAEP